MRLIHAMSLRDGGTTSITVTQGFFKRVSYTVDYSLPWDGRKRYVFMGGAFTKSDSQRLEIGCEEERRVQHWLTKTLNKKFGETPLKEFLADHIKNPGRGKWLYAFNFLRIMSKERCQQDGAVTGSQQI